MTLEKNVVVMTVVCFIYRVLQEWLFQDQRCILVTSLVYLQTGTINSFQLKCHKVYIFHFACEFLFLDFAKCQNLSIYLLCIQHYSEVVPEGLPCCQYMHYV